MANNDPSLLQDMGAKDLCQLSKFDIIYFVVSLLYLINKCSQKAECFCFS